LPSVCPDIKCLCVCLFAASRSTSNDVDDSADHVPESGKKVTKKPSAEKAAPVKLVPAPPPKENIWEKRKSENQASRQQQSSTSIESSSEVSADSTHQSKTSSESLASSSQHEETTSAEKVSYLLGGVCEDVKRGHVLLE